MRWLLVAVVAVAAAGCSSGEEKTTCAPGVNCAADRFRPFGKCTHASGGFRACTAFSESGERSRIEGRRRLRWVVLFDENTAPKGGHGWWRRVIASPDRQTLLGQWSGECEIQSTYVVTLADRTMRPILEGLPSAAVGWRADGRARVRLEAEFWATKARRIVQAGVYRVNPANMAYVLERRVPSKTVC